MKNFTIKNKGFTIIETLVAITILMISIAGPLTIAQKSLNAATYAKDQVIASFLAQDEMENIKNNRDSIGYTAWIDTQTQLVYPCINKCLMYISTNGTYSNAGPIPTKFSKTITFKTINGYETEVTVQIDWNTGTISNSTKLVNYMYNVIL